MHAGSTFSTYLSTGRERSNGTHLSLLQHCCSMIWSTACLTVPAASKSPLLYQELAFPVLQHDEGRLSRHPLHRDWGADQHHAHSLWCEVLPCTTQEGDLHPAGLHCGQHAMHAGRICAYKHLARLLVARLAAHKQSALLGRLEAMLQGAWLPIHAQQCPETLCPCVLSQKMQSCWYAPALTAPVRVRPLPSMTHNVLGAWRALPCCPRAFGPTESHNDVVMTHSKPQHLSGSQEQHTTTVIPAGASKFLSGVLGSQTSPRILLAGGQPALVHLGASLLIMLSALA